ncbi:MAG: hypothetical protein ACKOJB_05880 [Chthoniobacterales bacterium]
MKTQWADPVGIFIALLIGVAFGALDPATIGYGKLTVGADI